MLDSKNEIDIKSKLNELKQRAEKRRENHPFKQPTENMLKRMREDCEFMYPFQYATIKGEGLMSYGRRPYYIYSDGENMSFDFTRVPEKIVNQFVYHVLLSHRRDDLKERLLEGRKLLHGDNGGDWYIDHEDSVIRKLMELD